MNKFQYTLFELKSGEFLYRRRTRGGVYLPHIKGSIIYLRFTLCSSRPFVGGRWSSYSSFSVRTGYQSPREGKERVLKGKKIGKNWVKSSAVQSYDKDIF